MRSLKNPMTYSAFDPEAFMSAGNEITDAFDTSLAKVPPGEWRGQVSKVMKPRKFNDKNGEERIVMDIIWEVLDEDVKKMTELDKPTCRQSIFLDVTEEGALAKGKNKNVSLGRLRDAMGQNEPGRAWHPNMLLGALAIIKVEQKPNPDNQDDPYVNVTNVAELS